MSVSHYFAAVYEAEVYRIGLTENQRCDDIPLSS